MKIFQCNFNHKTFVYDNDCSHYHFIQDICDNGRLNSKLDGRWFDLRLIPDKHLLEGKYWSDLNKTLCVRGVKSNYVYDNGER